MKQLSTGCLRAAALTLLLLLPDATAFAGKGEALLFAAPGRFKAEATRAVRMKYKGAKVHVGLTAAEILAEIERVGRSGRKISHIEIFSHGMKGGPYTTAGLKDKSHRLTVDTLKAWSDGLRARGVDPKSFFTSNPEVTIRSCFVGKGDLPTELLALLPEGARVRSDFGYYKNGPLAAYLGGTWSRMRVTTHTSDVIHLAGSAGKTIAFKDRFTAPVDWPKWEGTWSGTAEVAKVHALGVKKTVGATMGTSHGIPAGAFVLRKTTHAGNEVLELNYRGNILYGVPDGGHCVFEPDVDRGGKMSSALLNVSGTKITGKLVAESDTLHLVRSLTLSKE